MLSFFNKTAFYEKNLNMIVANDASNMQKTTNQIRIIKSENSIKEIPEKEKSQLAFDILKEIEL